MSFERIPVSRMNAMVAWQMSETPTEDLEVLESAYEEAEAEVMASLEERIRDSIEMLQHLHSEVRSLAPKVEMLTDSSEILQENTEKARAVLTRATENLQAQRAHNQRLRNKLHSLERRVQVPPPVNVFIRQASVMITSTLVKHS